jgi:hypothetical protein
MTLTVRSVLSDLLRDEHAAIYAYGVLGARLDDRRRKVARAAFDAHRAARDALRARLLQLGAEADGPAPAYDVMVDTVAQALALAVRIEEHLSVRWRDLVGTTDDVALRRFAVQGLQDAAVRAALWRRAAGQRANEPFPGEA